VKASRLSNCFEGTGLEAYMSYYVGRTLCLGNNLIVDLHSRICFAMFRSVRQVAVPRRSLPSPTASCSDHVPHRFRTSMYTISQIVCLGLYVIL